MSDYNGSVVRAIRGPICLITIGALFALNNFTKFSFDQTWPVILIVFGLLSLLKRGVETSAPPTPPPMPSMPGGFSGGGYAKSPYSQTPAAPPSPGASTGSPSEPAKGGFGTTATPRTDAPSPAPPTSEGGSI